MRLNTLFILNLEKEDMKFNKKDLMIFGLTAGIMLFFLGLASAIALGPTTDDYQLLCPYCGKKFKSFL
jgi:hypothetical protein